jgi:hypothetical protein
MSEEIRRLARTLEEDAARLASGELEAAESVKLAGEVARMASEAAALLDRSLREQPAQPRPPGQGSLPVNE